MSGAVLLGVFSVLAGAANLPDNFDPQVNMRVSMTEKGPVHSVRDAAELAAELVADGSTESIEVAVKVLDAVLACQERHPEDAHYGNFLWSREDQVVEDLNAVEFTLSYLIPMMLQHGDRVPQPMRDRVLEAIRLGLDEIKRLDVSIAYTNITSLDVFNSCLGGEVLNDAAVAARGKKKLLDWIAFTNTNGTVYEFNSPTYMGVTLNALARLAQLAPDNADRVRARAFAARLALGSALHIHPSTGRWAGPHSRAYSYTTFALDRPEIDRLAKLARGGAAPSWLETVVASPIPRELRETSGSLFQFTQTTYLAPSFALGVASRELIDQSNCFIGHYLIPGRDDAGVVFSRYMINDERRGKEHGSEQFFDAGRFYGVQECERAVGLYAPPKFLGTLHSAKAVIVWPKYQPADEIWAGGQRVTSLPYNVERGKPIVVGAGAAWMAIMPLRRKDFKHDSPIRLVEQDGALVLEMYNYLGPKKLLWEMEWPGGFYQGQPECGFYAEFADRNAYPDGKSFAAVVASGTLTDQSAPPATYTAVGKRPWKIEYARDGRALGIEVDLYEWLLERRWTHKGGMDMPMLESPVARETRDGQVEVDGATFTCGPEAAWLFSSSEKQVWSAGYLGMQAAPATLTVPGGSVSIDAMGMGTIVWDKGAVTIDALDVAGQPRIVGGTLAQ